MNDIQKLKRSGFNRGTAQLDGNLSKIIIEKCSRLKYTKFSKPKYFYNSKSESFSAEVLQNSIAESGSSVSLEVILSSTMCPSLHGISNWKIDRIPLAKFIVHGLRESYKVHKTRVLFVESPHHESTQLRCETNGRVEISLSNSNKTTGGISCGT